MDSRSDSEKLLSEYREKYDLYEDFAAKVASILEQVLKDNDYRYQIVSYRAKKPSSAGARFLEKKCKLLGDLKDLAGCRVIFYLESDIETFVYKAYEAFGKKNILDYKNKISTDSYNAVHLVVCLGEDRIKHPEYKRFEGVKCEIQLTTVLHHAWSEMEHDLVYKPQKELTDFDAKAFGAIKESFKRTMKEHIQPAIRDFEHIFREHEKLKKGRSVFDVAFLKKIEKATSLNEMQDNLKLLAEYVKEFGDKTPKELKLIPLIKKVLVSSRVIKPQTIKTTFGKIDGATHEKVALTVLEILEVIRYLYIKETCEICFELIKTEKNSTIVNQAKEVLSKLCEYNLQILRTGGLSPQQTVLSFLERSGLLKEPKTIKAVASILHKTLTLSFNGVESSNYNAITFRPTSLKPTENLKQLRAKAIGQAKKLFRTARTIGDKKAVIVVFEEALRWPEHGVLENEDEFNKMLSDDEKKILTFFAKVITKKENETVREIESNLMFLERDPRRKNSKSAALIKAINENPAYQIYKVFVGYDTDFYPNLNFEKAKEYRNAKIREYIEQIEPKNLNVWGKIFKKITKNYKELPPGSYSYFSQFLFELGKKKPYIALTLINEKSLEAFLIDLVAGIWKSNKKNSAKKLIRQWSRQYKNFLVCTSIFDYVEEIDTKLFKQVVAKAIKKHDVAALNSLVASIGRNYNGQPLLRTAFLQIITILTHLKNTFWIQHIWFRKKQISADLTRTEFAIVLDNLLLLDRLDYYAEGILEPLVNKYPADFVRFLFKRVERSIPLKKKRKIFSSYDAIPHSFDKLDEGLRKNAKIVIPLILKWFSLGQPAKDKFVHHWEATHLLKDIFPNSDPLLQNELVEMIKRKGKEGRIVIDSFISRFEGETFLWTLIKEVIKAYKKDASYSEIKSSLFSYLSQTGVVSGEYGFVEAHTAKKNNLQALKTTAKADVLAFLNEYEAYLEKLITSEQKMADDDIDRRKREYGI